MQRKRPPTHRVVRVAFPTECVGTVVQPRGRASSRSCPMSLARFNLEVRVSSDPHLEITSRKGGILAILNTIP